jgi:hypothetical protein
MTPRACGMEADTSTSADSLDLEGQYLESAKYMKYHIVFRNDGIIVNYEDNQDRHEVIRSLAGNASDSLDKP